MDSPVRAARGLPARTQAPQAGSSDRKERTTQAVPPSPRRACPMVTMSGPTRIGPLTPPVALSQVLNLDSEEPMYRSSEDELEHRARGGSPHSHRSGERDPPAMDVDEESTSAGTGASPSLRGRPGPSVNWTFLFWGPGQTVVISTGLSGLHGAPSCI